MIQNPQSGRLVESHITSQGCRTLRAAAWGVKAKLLRLFVILFLIMDNTASACEKDIPIEVKWEFDKKPTKSDVGYLMILAPLKHEGFSLRGVQLYKEESTIPVMKYISEREFPGKALFQVTVTSLFLKNSRFTATYTSDPIEKEDGSIVYSPCLHTQNIEVKV